jgi:hypothetical protein
MSINKNIVINNFSSGYINDLPQSEIPESAATRLDNFFVEDLGMTVAKGITQTLSGLPTSNFVVLNAIEFPISDNRTGASASSQIATLVHGTLNNVHKLYITPKLSEANPLTWQTGQWQELTENTLNLTADSGTTTTSITDTALTHRNNDLPSQTAVDNYYKNWIVLNTTRGGASVVTASSSSANTLTLAYAITGQVAGDTFALMRNPVYDRDLNYLFQPSQPCRFLAHENNVEIYTGSDKKYPDKSDLSLRFMTENKPMNEDSLEFSGFYLGRRNLDFISGENIISSIQGITISATVVETGTINGSNPEFFKVIDTTKNFTTNPDIGIGSVVKNTGPGTDFYSTVTRVEATVLHVSSYVDTWNPGDTYQVYRAPESPLEKTGGTTSVYVFAVIPIYDGFQEGPLEPGIGKFNGKTFTESNSLNSASGDVKARITLSVNFTRLVGKEIPSKTPNDTNGDFDYVALERHISGFYIYAAKGTTISGTTNEVNGEWRQVEFIPMSDSRWGGTLPNRTISVDVSGVNWTAATSTDITTYQGHSSLKVHLNGTFAKSVGGITYAGNVFSDKLRKDFIVASAVKGAGANIAQNMYSVFPFSGSKVDLSRDNIPEIMGLESSGGFLVVFGKTSTSRLDFAGTSQANSHQRIGVSSPDAILNIDNRVYTANNDDVYFYQPTTHRGIYKSIGESLIQKEVRGISSTLKEKTAIGYDRANGKLFYAMGTTVFVLNLSNVRLDTLAEDLNAQYSWSKLTTTHTFVRFYTKDDGRCVGITDTGQAYLMYDSTTNTGVWESKLFDQVLDYQSVRLYYTSTAPVTVGIIDTTKNETNTIRDYQFPTNTNKDFYTVNRGLKVRRFKVRITAPYGTTITKVHLSSFPIEGNF